MSCGSGCALSALRAPSDMMNACNISTRPNHDNDKRDHIDYSNLHLCDNSHGSGAFLFGRRNIGSESEQQKQDDQILQRNRGQYHVSSTSLRSWCSKFSRYNKTTQLEAFKPLTLSGLIQQTKKCIFFPQKIDFDISCKLFPKKKVCMTYQSIFISCKLSPYYFFFLRK